MLYGLDVKVAICAPFTQIVVLAKEFQGTGTKVGAQNMHFADEGAFTGEISADMLKELGADYCIIGHSERRLYFGETDETVNKKLHTAFKHDIFPFYALEVLRERDEGKLFQWFEPDETTLSDLMLIWQKLTVVMSRYGP